jgi:hypothetical protein
MIADAFLPIIDFLGSSLLEGWGSFALVLILLNN